MKICVLCGEIIEERQLTDRTGEAHLECLIEEEGGCTDETGLFLSCVECWNPCPYRQALPHDLVTLQKLKTKGSFIFPIPLNTLKTIQTYASGKDDKM